MLFVYGTLKRGWGNNRLLSTSKYICDAVTRDKFVMFRTGFPVLMREPAPHLAERFWLPVRGEVYEVNDERTWEDLDGLEGVPHMYTRGKCVVDLLKPKQVIPTDESETAEVEVYLGTPDRWYRRFTPLNFQDALCAVQNGAYEYQ